jgi:hypothetical protein
MIAPSDNDILQEKAVEATEQKKRRRNTGTRYWYL